MNIHSCQTPLQHYSAAIIILVVIIACLFLLTVYSDEQLTSITIHSQSSTINSNKSVTSHLSKLYCTTIATSFFELIRCVTQSSFPQHFLGESISAYNAFQPTDQQRTDFRILINKLVSNVATTNMTCHYANQWLPSSLASDYAIHEFVNDTNIFCVLEGSLVYDKQLRRNRFHMGWPVFVIWKNQLDVLRPLLHLSAPHLLFDGDAELIAAHSFQSSRAKSLLLWPRHRNASTLLSTCIITKQTRTSYYARTDPVHNNDNMFHDAMVTLYAHERQQRPECFSPETNSLFCSITCPLFVQMHGKRAKTCSDTTHFVSHGTGNISFYATNPQLPVHRIVAAIAVSNSLWTPSYPVLSTCKLVASNNIAGRVINNVTFGQECTKPAQTIDNFGRFVHIEQTLPDIMTCFECWDKIWSLVMPVVEKASLVR